LAQAQGLFVGSTRWSFCSCIACGCAVAEILVLGCCLYIMKFRARALPDARVTAVRLSPLAVVAILSACTVMNTGLSASLSSPATPLSSPEESLMALAEHSVFRRDGQLSLPECDCSCCVAEVCPCSASDADCRDEVLCLTHKGPNCHQWVGENMEATFCDSTSLWNYMQKIDPYDARFILSPSKIKHDMFCHEFCGPQVPLAGEQCLWKELPTLEPTQPPCPDNCGCNGNAEESSAVAGDNSRPVWELAAKRVNAFLKRHVQPGVVAACPHHCCADAGSGRHMDNRRNMSRLDEDLERCRVH